LIQGFASTHVVREAAFREVRDGLHVKILELTAQKYG
jgi:hypothetical protein